MKFFRFAPHRPPELNRPWIFSFLYPRPSQLQGTSFSIILLSDLHRKNTADGGNLSDRKQNCGIWVSLLPVYSLSLEYWIVDRYYRRYISSLSFFALLLIQMIAEGGTEERCDLRKKVFVFPIIVGAGFSHLLSTISFRSVYAYKKFYSMNFALKPSFIRKIK